MRANGLNSETCQNFSSGRPFGPLFSLTAPSPSSHFLTRFAPSLWIARLTVLCRWMKRRTLCREEKKAAWAYSCDARGRITFRSFGPLSGRPDSLQRGSRNQTTSICFGSSIPLTCKRSALWLLRLIFPGSRPFRRSNASTSPSNPKEPSWTHRNSSNL